METTPPLTSQELATQNHKLIYFILYKYNLPIEEWYDIAAIGLVKAANTYNPEKGFAFSTYAFHCIINSINLEKRNNRAFLRKSNQNLIYLDTPIPNSNSINSSTIGETIEDVRIKNFEEESILMNIVKEVLKECNERNKQIIIYYLQGYSQKEISGIFKMSQPSVSRVIINFKNEVKRKIK